MAKFKKGQSGNPGGRPAIVKKVRELAQKHSEEAIRGLVSIAQDTNEKGATRVAAWKEILDRGLGKSIQGVEVSGPGGKPVKVDTRKLTDKQLDAALEIARIMSQSGEQDDDV